MASYFNERLDTTSANDKILIEPFLYICQKRGKEIRTKLLEAFDVWLKVPPEKLRIICDVVEMLHNASLLIDDVQDDSALRRGIPVAHKIYGVPTVINSANFIYFVALQRAMELNDNRIFQVFSEEMLNLHRGQGMEIHWRESGICPSVEEYLEMKLAGYFALLFDCCRSVQTQQCKRDYVPLVNLIGIHYQIRDDYLNLTAEEYSGNKGFAEDLTEGKFSYLVIHAIREDTSNSQLWNILRQKTSDVDVKKYAIELMKRAGSFEATARKLRELENEARREIAILGGNAILEVVMDQLSSF